MKEMIDLGRMQAALFLKSSAKENKDVLPEKSIYFRSLVDSTSMFEILLSAYRRLVFDNKIIPIEELTVPHKLSIWDQAKKIADGRLDNEKCKALSKILYTIEFFLNE